MTQKGKITILIVIIIILAIIVAGLLFYYLKPKPSVYVPPADEGEAALALQAQLENIIDFSFVSSPYSLDSIVSSNQYKQIKQDIHDVCYDGSFGLYFSCLRALDAFAAIRINDQLFELNPQAGQELLDDLYQIDERYGVPSVDIRNPETIFTTAEGMELISYFEKTLSLEDLKFNNSIDEVYQKKSFNEWLDAFHAKKKDLCYFPPKTDIAKDCDSFTTPYASSLVIDFLYPGLPEDQVITLVGILERGIYKSEEDLLEIYNDLLNRYYDDFLNNYVQQMKSKYPALASGQVTDLNSINDFLLDPMDSVIYQVGKLYYYVNYLHVGSKGKVRDTLDQQLNDEFVKITADLGINNDDLKNYLIATVGDEDAVIEQLISQYNAMKAKYPANIVKLEVNPTFLFWESMVEDKYYDSFIGDFTDRESYYNDLRQYRLYTYLLLYYGDTYKHTNNRQEAFKERGVDEIEMQNVFKFSRYIERDELDALMSKYNKPRGEIINLSEGH